MVRRAPRRRRRGELPSGGPSEKGVANIYADESMTVVGTGRIIPAGDLVPGRSLLLVYCY